MTNYSYKTPYDEGYADGEEMAQKRIAELEAFLTKLQNSGDWYWSALEFDIYGTPGVDGDKLKQELDALLEDK